MSVIRNEWVPYYCFIFVAIVILICAITCSKQESMIHPNRESIDGYIDDEDDPEIDNISLGSGHAQVLYHPHNGNIITNPIEQQREQYMRQCRRLRRSKREKYQRRRQKIMQSIITKKVVEGREDSSTTSSYRSNFNRDNDTKDLENQLPPQQLSDDSSPKNIDLSNRSGRLFHSFASALVKSKKSVTFSVPTDHNRDNIGNPNHNTNNDKSIKTRRKSNILARRISLSLQTLGTESEPIGCNICLMEFQIGEDVAWSKNPDCIHGFHMECIVDWLLVKNECPVCRRDYMYRKQNKSTTAK